MGNEAAVADHARTKPKRKRYIYFIREGLDGPIKVGSSFDVHERLATLQIGNSSELYLMCAFPCDRDRDEAGLHEYFREHHIRGEWFHPAERLLTIARTWGEETRRQMAEKHLTNGA